MKLHHLLAAALLAAPLASFAQVRTAWSNAPGGVSVAVDSRAQVYTARWDYAPGGDIWLARRNRQGRVLWEARYDNPDPTRHEVATWVAVDRVGNAWVSGTIRSGFSSPVNAASVLMRFDAQGRLLWRQVYTGDFDGSSTRKVLVDGRGRAYVLGLGPSANGLVTQVRQFAPDGTPGWVWSDTVGVGAPLNLKFTPDRGLLVVGRALFGNLNGYARLDTAGRTVWANGAVPSLTAGDAAGDAAGNTYLVYGQNVVRGSQGVVRKLAPDGSPLWEQTVPLSAFRVEVGRDQQPVVSGYPSTGAAGAAFAKLTVDGALQWANLDADGPGQALLLHTQMLLDAQDNAYLGAGTLFQMAVCKVHADGTPGWTAGVSGSSTASGIALSPDGAVLAVGGTTARLVQTPAAGAAR